MAAAKAESAETFDDDLFETRLEALKDTQEGIQQMSSWCMQHRSNHKKIVACWLNVFKKVRVEQRLNLFYLANDVVQYSKRKGYEFVESWATALQRATTMVRDDKVKNKILRIFKIWEQRAIYNEEYLSDLRGLLNMKPSKKTIAQAAATEVSDDYQNATLINHIRECVDMSDATDKSFKKLPKSPTCDIDCLKTQMRDKSHKIDSEGEYARYVSYVEVFNQNLHSEIKMRKAVISNVAEALKFYANQRVDVKVVVGAYKSFGNRIKSVKKRLDEVTPKLLSPIPSPDINAPSPERDADLQLPDEQTPISTSLLKHNINGYASYLDGNLPFDINDFKREESTTKSSSQPIEVIGSRSDDENFSAGVDYYKPESISVYSSGSDISIPGLNPMPVPPVHSEYTSLARSAQQYSNILPPPTPPLFGNNMNASYGNVMNRYDIETNYHTNSGENSAYSTVGNQSGGANLSPLMPPPPMPPLSNIGPTGGNAGQDNTDFNSTWNMNMAWSGLNNSTNASSSYNQNPVDTPVSPPHFERERHGGNVSTIEYSEQNNNMSATQDVDHRQLHLSPAFNLPVKQGPNKDKMRQLDIDHRNLISLTGSPGINDNEKKPWLLSQDQDMRPFSTGDQDYRVMPSDALKTINTEGDDDGSVSKSTLMAPPSSTPTKKSNAAFKNNADSQKDDGNTSGSTGNRYDPTDMVVDMDMSDEDLDDIFREVQEQTEEESDKTQDESLLDASTENADSTSGDPNHTALLERSADYGNTGVWDTSATQMNAPGYNGQNMGMDMQFQQQAQQQQGWNQMQMPWNGNNRGADGVPPPPRPPFPLPFGYPNSGSGEYVANGSRGRGRGWMSSPQNQFRGFPRPPRGGGVHGIGPYFNRGSRGGVGGVGGFGARGAFRGKFRGNNAWI